MILLIRLDYDDSMIDVSSASNILK